MVTTVTPIIHRILQRNSEQPLFNTQPLVSGQREILFFTSVEPEFRHLSNSDFGSLPYPDSFLIKRISLVTGPDTNFQKLGQLLKTAKLEFLTGFCIKLVIPASLAFWGDTKDIDLILRRIKKLPASEQQVIIRNLKIVDGHPLDYQLVPQENFCARLFFPNGLQIKEKMSLTCLLSGILVRERH